MKKNKHICILQDSFLSYWKVLYLLEKNSAWPSVSTSLADMSAKDFSPLGLKGHNEKKCKFFLHAFKYFFSSFHFSINIKTDEKYRVIF